MRQMLPNSQASRCLSVLREGPATTCEIAAETGLDSHTVGCHLNDLHQRGKVTRKPFDGRRDAIGRVKSWLWQTNQEQSA